MADPDTTVFLSYRRDVSGPMAYLVRNDLVRHGFDVFMDVGSLGGGEFEPAILREIEARTHFLVLLEPGSLDRVDEPGDWLRREIAHALTHRRNIVPLLAGGVRMPRATDLPADLARLPSPECRHRLPRVPRRGDGEASRLVAAPAPPGPGVVRRGRHAAGPAPQRLVGPAALRARPAGTRSPPRSQSAARRRLLVYSGRCHEL
jgi:hypothetical protein